MAFRRKIQIIDRDMSEDWDALRNINETMSHRNETIASLAIELYQLYREGDINESTTELIESIGSLSRMILPLIL